VGYISTPEITPLSIVFAIIPVDYAVIFAVYDHIIAVYALISNGICNHFYRL
jgi:hypothetical protein